LRLMLSSSTASHEYTLPEGFTATTCVWSLNSWWECARNTGEAW
jgi:hypothetical protein